MQETTVDVLRRPQTQVSPWLLRDQAQTNGDPFDYTGLEIHNMSLSSQTFQVNKS
jgi:hypothetical protein